MLSAAYSGNDWKYSPRRVALVRTASPSLHRVEAWDRGAAGGELFMPPTRATGSGSSSSLFIANCHMPGRSALRLEKKPRLASWPTASLSCLRKPTDGPFRSAEWGTTIAYSEAAKKHGGWQGRKASPYKPRPLTVLCRSAFTHLYSVYVFTCLFAILQGVAKCTYVLT